MGDGRHGGRRELGCVGLRHRGGLFDRRCRGDRRRLLFHGGRGHRDRRAVGLERGRRGRRRRRGARGGGGLVHGGRRLDRRRRLRARGRRRLAVLMFLRARRCAPCVAEIAGRPGGLAARRLRPVRLGLDGVHAGAVLGQLHVLGLAGARRGGRCGARRERLARRGRRRARARRAGVAAQPVGAAGGLAALDHAVADRGGDPLAVGRVVGDAVLVDPLVDDGGLGARSGAEREGSDRDEEEGDRERGAVHGRRFF